MTLPDKTMAAGRLANEVMRRYRRPALMCSFGKDSLALLHLLRELGLRLPVLFHREPFAPGKYHFANRIIEEWGLTVYDYPPTAVAMVQNADCSEVMNFYEAGSRQGRPYYVRLPTGLTPPVAGEPFLCARRDLLEKPTGTFRFPWDVVFVGHKSTDVDPINGPMPLTVDVHQNPGGCDLAFPLRHFTDADVWAYHAQHHLPVHHERYEQRPDGTWTERADRRRNPDYFEACWACVDRTQPATVRCPLSGYQVDNISGAVPYVEPIRLPYFDDGAAGSAAATQATQETTHAL